jgi:hypothetical protein
MKTTNNMKEQYRYAFSTNAFHIKYSAVPKKPTNTVRM